MSADLPLVSIIIPCHNAERYVADAIQSALDQTYLRKEVIVVDDGSTDGSLNVIRRYEHRIRYWTGANRGACAARNTGIRMALGQFLQFLDADDLLHPRKLEIQVPLVSREQRALVYCDQEVISLDADSSQSRHWNRNDFCVDPVEFMLRGDLSISCPVHWKESVEAIGGFREDLPGAQDRDFHLRLALSGISFRRVATCLFTIRRRQGSISTSDPGRIFRCQGEIVSSVYETLKSQSELTEARRRACAAMSLKAARGLMRFGQHNAAQTLVQRAYAMHPSGGIDLVFSKLGRFSVRLLGVRLTTAVSNYCERFRPPLRRQSP